jgi:uncharacterized spore protein YtfJ
MSAKDLISTIAERVSGATQVNAVFGEPRVIGSKTIIPIAAAALGFGGGAGRCKPEKEDQCEGEGGGGGGGGAAKPIAVLEVTEQETRIIPVIDLTKVILASICVIGCTAGMIIKLIGRNKK